MSDPWDFVVAIQCRTGSTRLPGKMTRTFHDGKTILEIMVEELLSSFDRERIVIATSTANADDAIESLAENLDVECSRGSEEDVLDRVWHAVKTRNANRVARVCADNPFLRASFLAELLAVEEKHDYASFQLADGTPTILSHLGLFAEVVSFDTLAKLQKTAVSKRHREHLTSHILDNPTEYQRCFLNVPEYISSVANLRLTVDTELDFLTSQQLFELTTSSFGPRFSAEQLMSVVQSQPSLLENMSSEIAANAKG